MRDLLGGDLVGVDRARQDQQVARWHGGLDRLEFVLLGLQAWLRQVQGQEDLVPPLGAGNALERCRPNTALLRCDRYGVCVQPLGAARPTLTWIVVVAPIQRSDLWLGQRKRVHFHITYRPL